MPAGHESMLHGVQGAQPIPTASTATVLASGVIKVSDAVKDKVKMGATVFLSGRGVPQGGQPGMVLLAKKLMVNHSEIAFELTTDDLMGMGGPPTGPVMLAARVDQDEDASTKQPGDVEGQLGPVTLPARSVAEFLRFARERPGKLNYGTGNTGGLVAFQMLKSQTGIDAVGAYADGDATAPVPGPARGGDAPSAIGRLWKRLKGQ